MSKLTSCSVLPDARQCSNQNRPLSPFWNNKSVGSTRPPPLPIGRRSVYNTGTHYPIPVVTSTSEQERDTRPGTKGAIRGQYLRHATSQESVISTLTVFCKTACTPACTAALSVWYIARVPVRVNGTCWICLFLAFGWEVYFRVCVGLTFFVV
ncbi:hypothetical protein CEXT_124101 [Caerostris extrusa]|uniref:Uncharacterized protein n=1 Tax=Caerostris extrusa TaxID=172846 RepID=A0AAV4MLF8_CAEEX|nr:hypothetical protein CEXT_124101 [Caerostris extrusa]